MHSYTIVTRPHTFKEQKNYLVNKYLKTEISSKTNIAYYEKKYISKISHVNEIQNQ